VVLPILSQGRRSTANVMRCRAERVRWRVRLKGRRWRVVEPGQFGMAVTVGGPHECDFDANVIQSDDAVHPVALDGCRGTVELHAELDENEMAASRSSTTTPMWSIRWIVTSTTA
jgi:hypothetical protein